MNTILAIEDSPLVQTQLQDILGDHYRLILCAEGETEIDRLARTGYVGNQQMLDLDGI